MYAITGITGQVGGATAQALLDAGHTVRAVVRHADKGQPWADKGCEIAVADLTDVAALTAAFTGVEGVFLMTPPNYDPEPGFPETRANLAGILTALTAARPAKLVFLSTVGAQAEQPNLLNNSKITEDGLRTLPLPVAFLRAAWFMENAAWDVAAAKTGTVPSFLQPLDHPIPMVATADIGRTAADLLGESWSGTRIVELEGPRRYGANDIAAGFATAFGHPVAMQEVPHETWESLFRAQGMKNPLPRIRMIDGFNEGWIDFEGGDAQKRIGRITLETVLQGLVDAGR
ncbi:MAG TPA: NAD(P)H-binding protein [Aliidongia sp.]|uniref:NmrA family NAD(P)-binding protein n=1 Tax=Aliidongia sp. TaxID=1914230 RepID=UPI002DDCA827|nr:NAD(P)H-binding protein [Aliidongia sp.]HEV2674951.1 NAD(P)H-binding protein [Aliidongia sp.]